MAEMNLPMNRTAGRRISSAAVNAPRLLMSWEDWLTLAAALITFVSIAVSIEQARWVANMPAMVPTVMSGLVIGLFAARIRLNAAVVQPAALALGAFIVVLAAQSFADGATMAERLSDFRLRMEEWFHVVRAGDISNDNLPFVTLVQAICFLSAYLAAFSIYRWHTPWFAVVPGGVVLLSNISFLKGQPSGAFVTYLFGAILLVARLHLQKSQARWKKQAVDYPEFMSLPSTQFTVIVATALVVIAWLIPIGTQAAAVEGVFDWVVSPATGQSENFVRLFHNVDSRKGAKLHSFGDTLPIQGNVKLGTKILLDVKSGEAGLIRATSYDEYTGTGWKATGRTTTRVDGSEVAPSEETAGGYKDRAVTILSVRVISNDSTIMTPGTPLGANVATLVDRAKLFQGDIERMRSRRGLESGDTYNAIGSESKATAESLARAGTDYPEWVRQRYLQLPSELPARVGLEAKRVAAGAASPYDRAVAIQDYLRTFPYDLKVESAPPGRDTVDYLLFELKRGYFDYQATAMTVMLRTLGIPARVAVGYVLDPSEAEETNYTVRKDDAYSWVEVFFPGYGWVNFNPTQDQPAGGAGGLGAIGGANDTNFLDPGSLEGLFGNEDPTANPVTTALTETPVEHTAVPWTLIYTLAALLGAAAVLGMSARLAWNWGLGGLEGRPRLWAKTQRLAHWATLGAREHETPREWSRRMGTTIHREDDAEMLSRAYEESRYGRPDLVRIDDDETRMSYLALRNTLFNVVLRRGRAPREKDDGNRKR